MVTTRSVSVLVENAWITALLVSWRRKIAWIPVWLW